MSRRFGLIRSIGDSHRPPREVVKGSYHPAPVVTPARRVAPVSPDDEHSVLVDPGEAVAVQLVSHVSASHPVFAVVQTSGDVEERGSACEEIAGFAPLLCYSNRICRHHFTVSKGGIAVSDSSRNHDFVRPHLFVRNDR